MKPGLSYLATSLVLLCCGYFNGCCCPGHHNHGYSTPQVEYAAHQVSEPELRSQNCCGDKEPEVSPEEIGTTAALIAPHSRFHPVPVQPAFSQRVSFPRPGEASTEASPQNPSDTEKIPVLDTLTPSPEAGLPPAPTADSPSDASGSTVVASLPTGAGVWRRQR